MVTTAVSPIEGQAAAKPASGGKTGAGGTGFSSALRRAAGGSLEDIFTEAAAVSGVSKELLKAVQSLHLF